MNKKITISELSQLLSTNVSLINKKGWEDFLRLFFAQISEGLQAEGNVKIKGLGTFKVVTVDARKSKDVNTGANTIIPAHNKISFTPDSSLAETLNKPYAHFEPTYVLAPEGEVDAPESDDDDETTSEPETIAAAAVSQTTMASKIVVEESKAETIVEEPKVETVVEEPKAETIVEEPKVEAVVEEPKAEAVVEEPKAETIVEEPKVESVVEEPKAESKQVSDDDDILEEPEETEDDSTEDEDENIDVNPVETTEYAATVKRHDLPTSDDDEIDNEKSHGKKLGIAIILFLCILAVVALVAWMSDPNIVSKLRSKLAGEDPVKTEVIKTEVKTDTAEAEIEDQIIAEMTENKPEETNAIVDSTEKAENSTSEAVAKVETKQDVNKDAAKYTRFKDDFINYMKKRHPEMDITDQGDPIEEKLGNASRLTLVSLQHYGAKDFWVYIYLYNKDVIKNPNYIKAGTKIKIPKLDNKKFVNPDSEHSILTAKEIQHEFVK